jgi:hypothetical protein
VHAFAYVGAWKQGFTADNALRQTNYFLEGENFGDAAFVEEEKCVPQKQYGVDP